MQNVIHLNSTKDESEIIHATVKAVSGDIVVVQSHLGVMNARIAFSCFIKPMVDDLVVIDHNASQCYILSVLERHGNQDVEIEYPSNVNMGVADGDLNLRSSKGIRLSSLDKMTLVSDEANFIQRSVNLISDEINVSSRKMQSRIERLSLVSESVDFVTDQFKQRANTVIRWIDGLESSTVGNMVQKVKSTLTSHSRQSVITSEKDMRIDAERIHMG